jgi:Na+/proline symporter
MHIIDWIFVIVPLLLVIAGGAFTHRYMKSVADFMSGGRVAERYLLAVASGVMGTGATAFVAAFEIISHSGYFLQWCSWINTPVLFLVAGTGFVVYRYRETRALTLAQFFEIRYSKSFRVFAGLLGFVSGLSMFAIIPVIDAQVITCVMGFPAMVTIFSTQIPTHLLIMALLLSITVFLTLAGGLITVMVTNAIEGMLSQAFFALIVITLLCLFKWSYISEVLGDQPPGHSLLNPFDAMRLKDFNVGYLVMTLFGIVYGTMAQQSGLNAAGLTPHENRMGNLLARWRELGKTLMVVFMGVCALTYISHPHYAAGAAQVERILGQIGNEQTRQQMRIPIALTSLLPIGVRGAFCAILLMGAFGSGSNSLHAWGGLFIQDVLVPLRKKPFERELHIRLLQVSVTGVAVFAFLFGCLFQQTQYVVMWWAVTTAIYVGGAGATIIGGLYWKKGTTAGAWAALFAGAILSVSGIVAQQLYKGRFPLNGLQVSFYATIAAIIIYVIVSLLTKREDFNMDRMLHRGEYAVVKDVAGEAVPLPPTTKRKITWGKLIGVDQEFTLRDRCIGGGFIVWGMFWFGVVVVGTVWNMIAPWSLAVWSVFWHVVGFGIPVAVSVVTSIWFIWGGIRDMRSLFRRLRQERVNDLDDGTVVGHQNLDEHVVSSHET